MYKRVLVPMEKVGGAEVHMRHASTLVSKLGAEMTLLRVVTVVPSEEYFFKRVQVEEGSSGARRKADAEAYLAELARRLQDQGVNAEPIVIISDRAEGEAIVEYAVESDCDLIVLPNQRRSAVGRWLQGNITAKVQRRSRVPILLVREGA
ncbi:MAG: universal stress protein [Anaerolineae bacterium]|jgi:nucleotide-binding universal stress UspA family protein